MPKVRVADIAHDFGAHHSVAAVGFFTYLAGIYWLEIARPTATCIELRVRGKQSSLAANAAIDARGSVVPVLPGERTLRCPSGG